MEIKELNPLKLSTISALFTNGIKQDLKLWKMLICRKCCLSATGGQTKHFIVKLICFWSIIENRGPVCSLWLSIYTVPLLCLNSNTVRAESVHLLFWKTVHKHLKQWCLQYCIPCATVGIMDSGVSASQQTQMSKWSE